MPPSEQARWFAEEVQPHEPALRAYLFSRFPTLDDPDDLVQETYAKLLRARAEGNLRHAKAFLFTAARNAALDLFRRRHVTRLEPLGSFQETSVLEEQLGVDAFVDRQQELDILAEAVRTLPERCRQVVLLRYLDGLSYKEIAVRLDISPETVKVQLAKGICRCREFFRTRGILRSAVLPQERIS